MTTSLQPAATGSPPMMATRDATSAVLQVQDLQVAYRTSIGDVRAVDHVSFALQAGERLGLIGESGSGKTTMATALMRLTRPPGRIVGGHIVLDGTDLLQLDDEALRRVRLKEIALVPQGAMNSLNPVMRVGDQMRDAIEAHEGRAAKRGLQARVAAQFERVGLSPNVVNRYPHELSGGMKQRAVMAISTVLNPKVIIADEPTSALDVVVQRQVMQTLGRIQEGLGSAVVLIGHDMGLIAQFADLIGVMYAGRLVEFGPVDDVLLSPRHPYTRMLIESLPRLTVKGRLVGIPGLPPALLALPSGCSFHPRCPFVFERCLTEAPASQSVGVSRVTSCHLYPERSDLPPLPSSVVLDPDAPLAVVAAAMEGEEEPGRAEAEAALADEIQGQDAAHVAAGDSASGVTGLAQSDIDEMHRGSR